MSEKVESLILFEKNDAISKLFLNRIGTAIKNRFVHDGNKWQVPNNVGELKIPDHSGCPNLDGQKYIVFLHWSQRSIWQSDVFRGLFADSIFRVAYSTDHVYENLEEPWFPMKRQMDPESFTPDQYKEFCSWINNGPVVTPIPWILAEPAWVKILRNLELMCTAFLLAHGNVAELSDCPMHLQTAINRLNRTDVRVWFSDAKNWSNIFSDNFKHLLCNEGMSCQKVLAFAEHVDKGKLEPADVSAIRPILLEQLKSSGVS